MSETFYIKQNNTRTTLQATLLEPDGQATNLTGATVNFIMSDAYRKVIFDRPAIIHDAVNGLVWYVFQLSDTSNPGFFKGEFKVIFSDGSVETYPNNDYINVVINSSLG